MTEALNALMSGRSLSREEAEGAMGRLIDGPASAEQVAGFLVALRMKKESVEEIAGFVDCLSKRAVPVAVERDDLIDVCGTGGDCSGTFNVSTTVAFVLAGAGLGIAKHGNRSVSSRSGSFDVLEALGVRFETEPAAVARSVARHGLGFLFAPAFHPALKQLAPVRKALGIHTVFNAIGPLLNPVPVRRQLIGVYSPELLDKLARVLRARGAVEAMVVHGEDGLDELTIAGTTRVAHLRDGEVRAYTIRPEDCGLKAAPLEAIRGGDARENAGILRSILQGERGPRRDVVVLNAAAALLVGGKAASLKEGADRAAQAIDSGRAAAVLEAMGAGEGE